MLSKFIRYGISFVLTLVMFILGTAFHKLDTTVVGIEGKTQILNVAQESQGTAVVIYIALFIVTIVSAYAGRRKQGDIVSLIISIALNILRVIATLAVISVGASIIMFATKGLQFMQLLLVIVAIGVPIALKESK